MSVKNSQSSDQQLISLSTSQKPKKNSSNGLTLHQRKVNGQRTQLPLLNHGYNKDYSQNALQGI